MATVRIWHENLAALNHSDRLPLSRLKSSMHVHGGLRLEIAGRLVPHLGYFGPDDVCFGQWLEELWQVAQVFEKSDAGTHTFDEREQGQPAFVFERDGDRAFLTIAASEISDADGDPDWQRIEFSSQEFLAELARFRESFFAALRAAAPDAADGWLQGRDPARRRVR